MAPAVPIQPYSRFINMFRLGVSPSALYRIPWDDPETKPGNYLFEENGRFYTLDAVDGTKPEYSILRNLIEQGFREKLKSANCSFKGPQSYISYWSKPHPQRHRTIFHTYSGFEFRVAYYASAEDPESTVFYLIVDPHIVLTMVSSVGDLMRMGIRPANLCGLAARVRQPNQGDDFGVDCRVLSAIDNPHAPQCEVLNFRTSETEIVDANTLFLEPKPEVIQDKILDVIDAQFDLIDFIREKTFLASRQASKERFDKTQKEIVGRFFTEYGVFPFSTGSFHVTLEPSFVPVIGSGFPREDKTLEPLLLFDQVDSSATHLQPYHGLRAFGPFTKDKPEIKLALLGSKPGVFQLNGLVDDLNRGTNIMPGGVGRFFRTKLVVVDKEFAATDDVEKYIDAARSLAARLEHARNLPDVILIHLNDRTPETSLDSAYYAVKPVLMEWGLPTQMITPYALKDPQWKHANIASAIFAKAGGLPWVLAEDMEAFDMIVGIAIGERIAATRRAGAKPRFVSYANVFDRLGRWMFFESGAVEYQFGNHARQIAELIAQAANRYKELRKLPPRSIAVHYYKRFGRKERDEIIGELTRQIGDFRLALITIDDSHPMRLYDLGVHDGSFPRGHFVHLSDQEVLLSSTGFTELSNKRMGTPVFLKLSFAQFPEPFISGSDVAKQVLMLTRLNYKALTPMVGEPVTIKYARLAARFMAAFSEAQWKGIANQRIRSVPWFL